MLITFTVSYATAHLFVMQTIFGEYVFVYLRALFLFLFAAFLVAKEGSFKKLRDDAIDFAKPKCSIQFAVAIALTAAILRVVVFNILHETTLELTAKNLIDNCVVASVNEELLFRGIVLTTLLRNVKSVPPAVLISAAFFAACHNIQSLLQFAALLILGSLVGAAFHTSRSITLPIALHSMWNLGGFVNVSIGW